MSFEKAEQLLELARMATAHRMGITLGDVMDRFGCVERTAQRMFRALEHAFPDTDSRIDGEGRKRWRLPSAAMRDLMTLLPDELAALDLAITCLGETIEAKQLESLKEKILALVPRAKATRLETDYEALLEAQGFAARPGPRPRAEPGVMAAVSEAIKACRVIEIVYQGRADAEPRPRQIAPLGVMLGLRRYVVAKDIADPLGPVRSFRTDAIRSAIVTPQSFERDADFDLQAFAERAFGTFQSEKEFGEVIWRFKPGAVRHAREFEFHPSQVFEDQPDGSLVVRFRAAGHLEMCWHLYAWGDSVEVIAPDALKKLVEPFQRNDFPVLP